MQAQDRFTLRYPTALIVKSIMKMETHAELMQEFTRFMLKLIKTLALSQIRELRVNAVGMQARPEDEQCDTTAFLVLEDPVHHGILMEHAPATERIFNGELVSFEKSHKAEWQEITFQ